MYGLRLFLRLCAGRWNGFKERWNGGKGLLWGCCLLLLLLRGLLRRYLHCRCKELRELVMLGLVHLDRAGPRKISAGSTDAALSLRLEVSGIEGGRAALLIGRSLRGCKCDLASRLLENSL
jgi:hypothetical protein